MGTRNVEGIWAVMPCNVRNQIFHIISNFSSTGAALGHRLATYPCTPVDGSSASTSLRLGDRSRTPTRRSVSSGPVGLIAGSWSTAALAMRCETAPLHYDLRHSCRKQSRSAAGWRSNAGAPYRIRTRGSYDLRACGEVRGSSGNRSSGRCARSITEAERSAGAAAVDGSTVIRRKSMAQDSAGLRSSRLRHGVAAFLFQIYKSTNGKSKRPLH